MPQDTFEILRNLLITQFKLDQEIVKPESTLMDLGLDSLTLMEFIFAAEDAFSLRIPEEKLNDNLSGLTLGDVCKAIDSIKKQA
ncbi:MAG: acyl carrier protein [Betaproteobacteria bacterium]|nr:acyl carrier protein [Betaproteobacteria bacterium]